MFQSCFFWLFWPLLTLEKRQDTMLFVRGKPLYQLNKSAFERQEQEVILNMDYETVAMELITYSGNARSMAFGALEKAKEGHFEEAEQMLADSKKENTKAHNAQSELLFAEANGEKAEIGILLVHAQDHLMTSMLAIELIQELIVLHKEKADKGEK